ncbi:hypothetical protein MBANPS3_005722 [Mucor bainieri]
MLDTLLSRLKEEIAIDGSSIDAVWKYAESISNQVARESNISITPTIDGPYKAFIWNYIKQEPELEFFEEVAPSAPEQEAEEEEGVVNPTTIDQDVAMKEQQQQEGVTDQDPDAIVKEEGQEEGQAKGPEDDDVVAMEATPDDNGATNTTVQIAEADTYLLDMLQEVQAKDRQAQRNKQSKRKAPNNNKKKKATSKKKAAKPKKTKKQKKAKRPAKKKKRMSSAGHSDSDFEMDSDDDDSESEYDDSDLSEASSEEYNTEEDDDEQNASEDDARVKPGYAKHYPKTRRNEDIVSNPRNISQRAKRDNANLTAIQEIADLTYDQVQERYGSRLRIIASARLQDEQLYMGVPPDANITPSLVVILREIIKTRTKGLYQASITRLLDLDSRSTGHYVKSLEDKGAITRRGVSINSMFTNICVHARYSIESNQVDMDTVGDTGAENELPYNVNGSGKVFSQKALLDAMVDLALVAPNNLILAQDVLHGFGFNSTRKAVRKWFNRSIDELCLKGYFEKASIRLEGARHHRCLHLINVPEDYEARQASNEPAIVPVDELSFPIKIKTTKNHGIPIHHLLCDVPLESQILDVVTAAGTHGAVQKDISIALNLDEMRFLSKALEKLCDLKPGQGYEHYGIVRHFEFEGRVRRYRYFTVASSVKLNEGRDHVPPPLPDAETDESKYYERTIFYPVPHSMNSLARYRKMVRRTGHRNVTYKEDVPPTFRKPKLNADGTPRPKSKYILDKEKKIAAQKAAKEAAERATQRAAAEGSAGTSSSMAASSSSSIAAATASTSAPEASTSAPEASTSAPEASTSVSEDTAPETSTSASETSTDTQQQKPKGKGIQAFFKVTKEPRLRKSYRDLVRPPSPTPTPAPIIKQNRLSCPAAVDLKDRVKAASEIAKAAATMVPEPEPEPKPKARVTFAPEVSAGEASSDAAAAAAAAATEPPARKKRKYTKRQAATTGEEENPAVSSQQQEAGEPSDATAGEEAPLRKKRKYTRRKTATTEEPVVPLQEAGPSDSTTPVEQAEAPTSQSPAQATTPSEEAPTGASSKTYQPRVRSRSIADYFKLPPSQRIVFLPPPPPPSASASAETTSNAETSSQHDNAVAMDVDAEAADEARDTDTSVETRVTRSRSGTLGEQEASLTTATTSTAPTAASEEAALFRRYQHGKGNRSVNAYLEARVKILFEMLEELRLVEMGKPLAEQFEARAEAQHHSNKYKMDSKTLWTSALELEKRGQAQTTIVDCTLLSGKTVRRRVLFHRDMSPDSDEYKTYIAFIKERRTGISYRNLPKPVAEVNQVVRLSDQVEQMQKEAQELLVSGQVKKAKQLELRISELSKNLETFGRVYGKQNNTYWMIEAVQYGWITASIVRAKVFHRYLYRLLEAGVEGVDQETRVLTLEAVCDNMTFQLLAQVIGIFRPTRLISEFYKDVSNHKVKMADMSDELKHDLFDENTKFLRRLRKLFNCLEFLGITTGQFTEVNNPNFRVTKYGHIAPAYKLEQTVPIVDRKQPDEPVLREYTILTTNDFNEFWADLKYVSTARNADAGKLRQLPDAYENEMRNSLHSPRNWSTRSLFTRAQRKMLNERVDRANRRTPLNNSHEIRQLAIQLNMPIPAIHAYYEKVDAALERRHRFSKEKKLERMLMGGTKRRAARSSKYNIYSGRRVITVDSNHAFVGPRRKPAKTSTPFLDDVQDLPVIQGDGFKTLVKRRTRRRQLWSEQDDEILLYMYTILRHRSRQNSVKLSWVPAQKVFPDREIHTCRHRKYRLMGHAPFSEKHEIYTIYWDAFFREGLADGSISDAKPDDNINVDILSYIEYFVQRLQEMDAHPIDMPLPKTLAQANDMYEIARNETASVFFEDIFHDGDSLAFKLQTLHQWPFTRRIYTDTHYDQSESVAAIEDDDTSRLCSLARIYCLMTLMSPAEVFDPFHAYQILTKFSPQLMEAVYDRMKAEKTIINASGDRPIPGTCFALSAKFVKDLSGELPLDLFNQAKDYEQFLASQKDEKFKFMPFYASSGMMAVLLSAVSNYQISFGLTNLNMQMRKVNEVGFRTRGIGYSIMTQLGVDIQRNSHADLSPTQVPPLRKVHIKHLSPEEYDAVLSKLLASQADSETSALILAIVDALEQKQEVGMTLYQLKTKLQSHYHVRHDLADRDIIAAVDTLCYHRPALVCRVGFDAVRYVHLRFVGSWTINNTEAKDHVLSEKAIAELMSKTNGQFQMDVVRKEIVVPSLWIDINGHVTDLVLNGCKKAIVDLVMRKPGISEADIHRHMATGLSKREVHDVLDILVEQHALRRIQVQTILQQQGAIKSSIFAKKTLVKCSPTDNIGKLTHSCFWPTPKIFSATV